MAALRTLKRIQVLIPTMALHTTPVVIVKPCWLGRRTAVFEVTHLTTGTIYSKTCVKRPISKRQKIGFQDQLSLNAGQKYCRMLHSAILSSFKRLPFVIKIFVLSIFEWPFYTGFNVNCQGMPTTMYSILVNAFFQNILNLEYHFFITSATPNRLASRP